MKRSGSRKLSKKRGQAEPDPRATYLGPLESDDLGETRVEDLLVLDTEPRMRISRMLEIQPSGSIGIAGPRGSGKTTLLDSFRSLPDPRGKLPRRLSVVVSAPVVYDAREFILHLFSKLCEELLRINVEDLPAESWSEIASTLQQRVTLHPVLSLIGWLSAIIGTALVALILTGTTASLGALADQEATVLIWGVILGVLGYGLIFWQRISRYIDPKRRQKEITDTPYPQYPKPPDPKAHDYKDYKYVKYVVADDPVYKAYKNYADHMIRAAKWWLNHIRFQQSYSAGWAGSLKLPVGLEAGVNSAVSLASKQLSFPQIVDEFKKFVDCASYLYQVVIGIDELDKMESEDKAQEFLNQIKGILTCRAFYMVSVSEGAMSQFERKGRPFRDVFDSCFGHIIGVDHLNFEEATTVIGKRVKGGHMPLPFAVWCYCLSGGLPRDLMRALRILLASHGDDPDSNDLISLASSSIKSELKARLRRITFEAKNKMEAGIGVVTFMKKLQELKSIEPYGQKLLDAARELCQESIKAPEEIQPAYRELGIYLYYYATLLETFNRKQSTWSEETDDEIKEWANSLALARQSLGASSDITKSLLDDYQKNYLP